MFWWLMCQGLANYAWVLSSIQFYYLICFPCSIFGSNSISPAFSVFLFGGLFGSREWAPSLLFVLCREWHLSRITPTSFIDHSPCDCHFQSLFEALRISCIGRILVRRCTLRKNLLCYHNVQLFERTFEKLSEVLGKCSTKIAR